MGKWGDKNTGRHFPASSHVEFVLGAEIVGVTHFHSPGLGHLGVRFRLQELLPAGNYAHDSTQDRVRFASCNGPINSPDIVTDVQVRPPGGKSDL